MSRKITITRARAFFRDSFILQAARVPRKTAGYRPYTENQPIAKKGNYSEPEAENEVFLGQNREKLGHFRYPKFIYPTPKIKKEGI